MIATTTETYNAWQLHANELAEWANQRLVNRSDAWGSYFTKDGECRQTTKKGQLTLADLDRHFCGVQDATVGFHSTADGLCSWGAIDIDNHGGADAQKTEEAARAWYDILKAREYDPILEASNGNGGFHIWVLFSEPVASERVYAWLQDMIADYGSRGIPQPETFPKSATTPHDKYGNWLRAPGLHHKRDWWSQIWDGAKWAEGEAAVELLLAHKGVSGDRLPQVVTPQRVSSCTTSIKNAAWEPLQDWIQRCGVPVRAPKTESDGSKLWQFDVCPWKNEHTNGSAFIQEFSSGAVIARCHHESCPESICNWKSLQAIYGQRKCEGLLSQGRAEQPVEVKKPLFTETLDDPGDDEDVFLIDNCLVEGQPMFVGGKSKTMKTAILVDLAFALSAGAGYRFLDKFTVLKQCNVGMFSGESGKTTLKRRWRTIKAARSKLGATVPPVRVEYKVPALSVPEEIQRIVAAIREYKLNVLIFDPLYLGLLRGNRKVEPGNVFAMGELLTGIVEACVAEGCTPVFAHHDKKSADNSKDTSDLEDFTMAGFAEFARQWIKVKRRPGKPYVSGSGVHHLNINVEGSAGFGSACSFTIDEGTCKEPKWVVSSEPLISSREDKKREKEAAQMVEVRAERQRMYEAIAACPNISTRRIRDVVKIGLDKAESHLAALLAEKRICPGTATQKGGSAWKAC